MNRSFRLLWIGETTSAVGSSVASVALPLVALSTLHASAFAVSLLTAAAWLPWLLIGLLVGVWVDRLPRRRIMLAADVSALLLFLLVPLGSEAGFLSVPLLVGIALLGGVARVFFATAYGAFLPSLVAPEERVVANARLHGSDSAAQVVGPGIAGLLTQAAGAVTGVLVDALSFLVSALCLSRIDDDEVVPAAEARDLRREVREGLAFVLRDSHLRTFALFGGLSNLLLVGYQSILLTFLVRVVRLDAGRVGLLLALGQAGGVLGAVTARHLAPRVGTARFLLTSKFCIGLGAMLLPLTSRGAGETFLVAGITVVAGSVVAGNVVQAGFAQGYCPPALYGRISSSMQVVNLGAIPLGAVLGGALASSIGLRAALWVMTALLVPAAGVLLTGPIRHLRDLPVATPAPVVPDGDRSVFEKHAELSPS